VEREGLTRRLKEKNNPEAQKQKKKKGLAGEVWGWFPLSSSRKEEGRTRNEGLAEKGSTRQAVPEQGVWITWQKKRPPSLPNERSVTVS